MGKGWRSRRGERHYCVCRDRVRDGRSILQATAKKAPLGEGLRQAGGGGRGGREEGGKRQDTRDRRQVTSDSKGVSEHGYYYTYHRPP